MEDQQQSRRRPTRSQLLWTGGIVAYLTVAVLIGYRYDITLWDWIKLLIVPAVIAGGGLWFNRQQRERELGIAREQRERQLEIAERRTQDEALQAYLDQMGQLLLDKDRPLRQSKDGDEVRNLARARTYTVALMLGVHGRGNVVRFLYEAGLIGKDDPVVDLNNVFLESAYLQAADLCRAYLLEAFLNGAHLLGANLSDADLQETWLRGAGLVHAVLTGADLHNAILSDAKLSFADLSGANLRGADLGGATGITNEELDQQAGSLKGATMPNGQKYEDWLKVKEGRRGDGENGGPRNDS